MLPPGTNHAMPATGSPISPRAHRHHAVWVSLGVSALLHLLALYVMRDTWTTTTAPAAFRTRLAQIPRFEPRRYAIDARPSAPRSEMEYVESQRLPREIGDQSLGALMQRLTEVEAPSQPLVLREFLTGAKEDEPILKRVEMLRPSELGLADSIGLPAMDLLRIVDMARANRQHALVVMDPASRRDMLGYINLTRIRLAGAGTDTLAALDALARYVRDHSNLLVRVAPEPKVHFRSQELLKDPVIFLLQGGGVPTPHSDVLTSMSEAEKAHMGEYLRSGGMLYIEGSNRYLREMVNHLRAALGSEGHLFPLPSTHPVYEAFYTFGDGFPGEQGKDSVADGGSDYGWYYPAIAPDPAAETGTAPSASELGVYEEREVERQGLWGVEWQGKTVALLSDAGLYRLWSASFQTDQETATSKPALQAGMNIIFYALTREGTLTAQQERPVWMQTRPQVPVTSSTETDSAGPEPDRELLSVLDASLAVVRAPLGTALEGEPLVLRFNGSYRLEIPAVEENGVLIHNLPAGSHWLELRFDGKTRQLQVGLTGGHVTTVTFGVNRFAFVRQLSTSVQERRVRLPQWRDSFADLELEELYLGEDREVIEASARALKE